MDVLEGDVELTEFEAIDVTSVKGVGKGANGFPILLMKGLAEPEPEGEPNDAAEPADEPAAKSGPPVWHAAAAAMVRMATAAPAIPRQSLFKAVAADGSVDEQPDIDGGKQAIALIAKLIGYEAQELEAGCMGEIWDIQLLCDAASALRCWMSGEVATQMAETSDSTGVVMDSTADDAAKADLSTSSKNDLPDSAFAYIEPGGSKDEDGKTTPRSKRHFPVHDKAHADNAAARIAQGAEFGDKAKAKVEAAQKKFGSNSDDTSKSADVADGGADVQTEPQGTGDLTQAVEDAVTKAMAPITEELGELRAFKAKVEALPVPGGPVMAVTRVAGRGGDGEDHAAKAAYFDQMAATVASPSDADNYRQLATQERAKATPPA